MLSHSDLRKGTMFILDGQPYEVLDFNPVKKARGKAVVQTKIKNLITGGMLEKSFHQGDVFEEVDMEKIEIKFLYGHRDKFFFCKKDDPKDRFELSKEQIGEPVKYLKPNEILEGIVFEGKIISASLPIKVQLKVVEAPPGVVGDRAQSGTKIVKLESGAEISAPLFIKEGDIIEINTQTSEYTRRV